MNNKPRIHPEYEAAVKSFDAAMRLFQKQNYQGAKEIFEKLANNPVREVADRARVHLAVCEQKLSRQDSAPKAGNDLYLLGVAQLNARNMEAAIELLGKADKASPDHEEIRYALASAHAAQGNIESALEHLKAAIALRPENRFQARHDEDFHSIAADPRFKQLVFSQAIPGSRAAS